MSRRRHRRPRPAPDVRLHLNYPDGGPSVAVRVFGIDRAAFDRTRRLASRGEVNAPQVQRFIRAFVESVQAVPEEIGWTPLDDADLLRFLGLLPADVWSVREEHDLAQLLQTGGPPDVR